MLLTHTHLGRGRGPAGPSDGAGPGAILSAQAFSASSLLKQFLAHLGLDSGFSQLALKRMTYAAFQRPVSGSPMMAASCGTEAKGWGGAQPSGCRAKGGGAVRPLKLARC